MRLIDADDLKDWSEIVPLTGDGGIDINDFDEKLKSMPTVDAVPVRHGKWIYGNDFHWYTASCSECGYQRRTDIKAEGWNQWKFCPMCGSRMDEERDSDHAEEEIL